jgi:GntR family transcriptional repressor for pyruvate dehydrogenase complex
MVVARNRPGEKPRPQSRPEKKTLTATVAESLAAFILEEGLQDGDLLPATAGLSDRYGVSRTVIREAIADLAGRGIVETSQGRETVVATPGQAQLFGLLQFRVLRDGVSPEQVQEARTAIEEITVSLAAKRKSAADLKALEAAVGQMAAAKRDGDLHEADLRFHRQLSVAAGNPIITLIFEGIEGLVREARIRSIAGWRAQGKSLDPVIKTHRAILEAVKKGDSQAAEKAMRDHMTQTEAGLRATRSLKPKPTAARARRKGTA